jgi:hypothetical protein
MAANGETLHTMDHRRIEQWAEERQAEPATVPGTEREQSSFFPLTNPDSEDA